MNTTFRSAFISVFYKDGLEPIVRRLHQLGVQLCSTGGTYTYIQELGIPCTEVEAHTGYPSILGGRVKTLHPKVFGGILARRGSEEDMRQIAEYQIPLFDIVIVDLYPFEETVKSTQEEAKIIEKIDIGGVSLIRAAAKNYKDVLIVASRTQYQKFLELLETKNGQSDLDDRKRYAAEAFEVCAHYDVAIATYFNANKEDSQAFQQSAAPRRSLRYGENPHQNANFYGDLDELCTQLHGKELSYNNLVDLDAALQLLAEFPQGTMFAIIKHTNVCGVALGDTITEAWEKALAGDPESAFGGVLATQTKVTIEVAEKINQLFFEILVAPSYEPEALELLKSKKNRILLQQKQSLKPTAGFKSILHGILVQEPDITNLSAWKESGGRTSTPAEKKDLEFGNIVCKHLKSNAIALVKNGMLIGKGCGQTSRIDALRQAIDKASQTGMDTQGAVLASDAFFPFDDCARMAKEAGITAIIQPGGSIRDQDTINYCQQEGMVLVLTGTRHFRH